MVGSAGPDPRRPCGALNLSGAPGRIRTCGLLIRSQALCPLSYGRLPFTFTTTGTCPQDRYRGARAGIWRRGWDSNPR